MVRGQGPAAAIQPMPILLAVTVVILARASRFFTWESE